jgi:Mn-containing catalase
MSAGTVRGPWNEGEIPGMGKNWDYIEQPIAYVNETDGLSKQEKGMDKPLADAETLNKKMSEAKSEEVKSTEPKGVAQWSDYEAVV